VAKIHRGATLTPHFREFLPAWVGRQPWYLGTGTPTLSQVGFFRFEDPAGEVGIETHLVTDGSAVYQVPMTYRGCPIEQVVPDAVASLVATAQHSVLGTRWIYDAEHDPVWVGELLRLVRTNGVSDSSGRPGVGAAEARGQLLTTAAIPDSATIELKRILAADDLVTTPNILGVVNGSWHPNGPDTPPDTGCLAVVRSSD
jgi:hypothetical protein